MVLQGGDKLNLMDEFLDLVKDYKVSLTEVINKYGEIYADTRNMDFDNKEYRKEYALGTLIDRISRDNDLRSTKLDLMFDNIELEEESTDAIHPRGSPSLKPEEV